jgi:hypothetical protein
LRTKSYRRSTTTSIAVFCLAWFLAITAVMGGVDVDRRSDCRRDSLVESRPYQFEMNCQSDNPDSKISQTWRKSSSLTMTSRFAV